jgi:energy-coupling factor transporter ATP-binding protein EcfA2
VTPALEQQIFDRLASTGADKQTWSLLVLAAMDSEAALDGFLEGTQRPQGPVRRPVAGIGQAPATPVEPPGVYVSSLTVEGFRGVGPPTTLTLTPGPGLTLVVGRNGSGKSSFAEGLEMLLTGRNYRWEKRTKAWTEGWRNLHHQAASLTADVVVEGRGHVTLARTWPGNLLTASTATARAAGQPPQPLDSLGWGQALTAFRPFLSYNELGSLLEEGPSKLYDALSGVLGLDELTAVFVRLTAARKVREQLFKEAEGEAEALIEAIEAVEGSGASRAPGAPQSTESPGVSAGARAAATDPRPAAGLRALRASPWDLVALSSLATGTDEAGTAENNLLRRLQSMAPPDADLVAAAVKRLRAAERAWADLAGSDADRSRQRANLLQQALDVHAAHESATCPVCGTTGALGPQWRASTATEIARLRQEAAACDAASASRRAAIAEAQRLTATPPTILAEAAALDLETLPAARRLWLAWSRGHDLTSADALASHLESQVLELIEAVRTVSDEADVVLQRRADKWQPMMLRLAQWLPLAKRATLAARQVPALKKAEDWWKRAVQDVRDERFKPIADRAMGVWKQLRLQSNVDLGAVELEGAAQRRRVALRVTVDGKDAEALGVMSQGELHSLALSLFLPRATLSESPFRFVSVDDPVQSMDPSRVEGLARALADAARTRQVIVFTHDDRLPEAVRRLGIPATVVGVTRRAVSRVEVRTLTDPVRGYLDDALAVVSTEGLPRDVAARVVPGFCRGALEAACMDVTRRRRLRKGQRHYEVEELLAANAKLYPLMALALLDDERQTGEVLNRLKQRFGVPAVDAFKACNAGAHEAYEGDVRELVRSVEKLTTHLAEIAA